MTSSERLTASLLNWAPWLAFLFIALPAPLYFLLRYFTATEEIGVWLLFAFVSLGVSSLLALVVVILLLLYRRRWEKALRERLARDGITADELSWFQAELTPAERRALRQMQTENPLLADAYGETLAARLTASRVIASARKELVTVERRIKHLPALSGTDRSALEEDLRTDRARLERITREAFEHKAEAETRLQMIEATASRGTSEAETNSALRRLGQMREHAPLALESARLERELRQQVEQELSGDDAQRGQLPSGGATEARSQGSE